MPILARYLLKQYLKVFLLCLGAFVAILLTTRFDEIAHFASLGGQGSYLLRFILYQLPYILPIALPISCLISVVVLLQRLCQWHELTAMRAAGMSLLTIISPILICALFLSLLNFYIVSELATSSHLQSNLLKTELRSVNPLLLLHNKHLMQLKGIYFDVLGPSRLGEWAEDVILSMPDHKTDRIHVAIAKKIKTNAKKSTLVGEDVTLITTANAQQELGPNHLMVENMHEMASASSDLAPLLKKKVWTLNNDHLSMAKLSARRAGLQTEYDKMRTENLAALDLKTLKRALNRIDTDTMRRCSVALAVFSFTLMGASFGISIGRNRKKSGILFITLFAAMYLIAYFAAKGVDHLVAAAAALYLIPHAIIIIASFWMLARINRGIEQ